MSNNKTSSNKGLVAIFDMDNTLIDSGRKLESDVVNAMSRLGVEISSDEARTQDWYGLAAKYGVSKEQFDKSFKQRKSWTQSLREGEVSIFPETYETLDRLLTNGVRLGLITRSDPKYTREKMDHFNFDKYFGDRVAITPISEKNKNREALELIKQLSPQTLSRAYFIGDRLEDVAVTIPVEREVGVKSDGLYVSRSGLDIPQEARDYRVIRSLRDVPRIIGEENGI